MLQYRHSRTNATHGNNFVCVTRAAAQYMLEKPGLKIKCLKKRGPRPTPLYRDG
jgi:hypothetical protein